MSDKQNYEVAPGINYEYVYVARTDSTKPTLFFLHGFPSSLHCWRHQIQYFSTQGYGCLAPNLMGYGKTHSPLDKNEYRMKSMVAHLMRLLDHLKLDRVVVVGHDWGTRPATRIILYHPERTLGLVLISVGYKPPKRFNLDEALAFLKQMLGYESMGYWEFFNADDAANLLESNADSFIDLGYTDDPRLWITDFAPLGKLRDWITHGKRTRRASYLTEDDYRVIRQCVTEGIEPKLNWYRSTIAELDWEDEKELNPTIRRPVLYIGGAKDYVCIPKLYASQKQDIPTLETVEMDTGHWVMEEKPNEVNQAIANWAKALH